MIILSAPGFERVGSKGTVANNNETRFDRPSREPYTEIFEDTKTLVFYSVTRKEWRLQGWTREI